MAGDNLSITRFFNAPRELVFRAWTDPALVARWWGPKGFTMPFCKIDLRPGGAFHSCMRAPDGKDYWGIGHYQQIVVPEKLVYTDSFSDEKGNVVPATDYGMSADNQPTMLQTVIFHDEHGQTRVTLEHEGLAPSDRSSAEIGWNQSFDRLANLLAEIQKEKIAA